MEEARDFDKIEFVCLLEGPEERVEILLEPGKRTILLFHGMSPAAPPRPSEAPCICSLQVGVEGVGFEWPVLVLIVPEADVAWFKALSAATASEWINRAAARAAKERGRLN